MNRLQGPTAWELSSERAERCQKVKITLSKKWRAKQIAMRQRLYKKSRPDSCQVRQSVRCIKIDK